MCEYLGLEKFNRFHKWNDVENSEIFQDHETYSETLEQRRKVIVVFLVEIFSHRKKNFV